MSQNKTVFPGLGHEDDFNPNQTNTRGNKSYARTSINGQNNHTIFPGMNNANENHRVIQNQPASSHANGKPIVGFLYSISRTGVGEFWPLHIGQNIIGQSNECDIVLSEGSVSQKHANLHINRMKKPEKTEATISDLGSTNGTQVNENSVSVARPVECVNGDIITIGENYDLLLVLIDTKALGLHISENFIEVEADDTYYSHDTNLSSDNRGNATRDDQDFPPRFNGAADYSDSHYFGGNRPTDSTIGMDSSTGFKRGGTIGMD